jgi:hypothetical protein
MFIIDDADAILKLRHETKIMRISNSISKNATCYFSEILQMNNRLLKNDGRTFFLRNEEDEEDDEAMKIAKVNNEDENNIKNRLPWD